MGASARSELLREDRGVVTPHASAAPPILVLSPALLACRAGGHVRHGHRGKGSRERACARCAPSLASLAVLLCMNLCIDPLIQSLRRCSRHGHPRQKTSMTSVVCQDVQCTQWSLTNVVNKKHAGFMRPGGYVDQLRSHLVPGTDVGLDATTFLVCWNVA